MKSSTKYISGSLASGGLIALVTWFFFSLHFAVELDGDVICAGTFEDPCDWHYNVTLTSPTYSAYYIYNKDKVDLNFVPDVKDVVHCKRDGRYRASKRADREQYPCGIGWREFDWKTPLTDRYAYIEKFNRNKKHEYKIVVFKENPQDKIKFGGEITGLDFDPFLLPKFEERQLDRKTKIVKKKANQWDIEKGNLRCSIISDGIISEVGDITNSKEWREDGSTFETIDCNQKLFRRDSDNVCTVDGEESGGVEGNTWTPKTIKRTCFNYPKSHNRTEVEIVDGNSRISLNGSYDPTITENIDSTTCDEPGFVCGNMTEVGSALYPEAAVGTVALWIFEHDGLQGLSKTPTDLTVGANSAEFGNHTVFGTDKDGCYQMVDNTGSSNNNYLTWPMDDGTFGFDETNNKNTVLWRMNMSDSVQDDRGILFAWDDTGSSEGFVLLDDASRGGDLNPTAKDGACSQFDSDGTDHQTNQQTNVKDLGYNTDTGDNPDVQYFRNGSQYATDTSHCEFTTNAGAGEKGYIGREEGSQDNEINTCLGYLMFHDDELTTAEIEQLQNSKHGSFFDTRTNFTMNFTFTDTNDRADVSFDCGDTIDNGDEQVECCAIVSGDSTEACYASGETDIVLESGTHRNVTIIVNSSNSSKVAYLKSVTLTTTEAPTGAEDNNHSVNLSVRVDDSLVDITRTFNDTFNVWFTHVNASFDQVNFTINISGIFQNITNNSQVNLTPGTYLVNASIGVNTSTNGTHDARLITIVQNTTKLVINSNGNLNYGTTSRVNCTSDGHILEGTVLKQNGTEIANPYNVQESALTRNYTCHYEANTNRSADNATQIEQVISKVACTVNLELNGTDGDYTPTASNVAQTVNLTATLLTGETQTVNITQNVTTLVTSGNTPQTDIGIYTAPNSFLMTANCFESENYTTSSEAHTLTLQNVTEVQAAPGEVTIYFDFLNGSRKYEFGSWVTNLSANITEPTGEGHQVCIGLNAPGFGANYSCGINNTDFLYNITLLRITNFSNGTKSFNATLIKISGTKLNISSNNRTHLLNVRMNLTGQGSSTNLNISYGTLHKNFTGTISDKNVVLDEFVYNGISYIETNITFTQGGSAFIFVTAPDNPKNLTFLLSGYALDLDNGFVFTEKFNLTHEVYNDTDTVFSDAPFGFFDDFNHNVSGRWDKSGDSGGAMTYLSGTTNYLQCSDGANNGLTYCNYDVDGDSKADLRNLSFINGDFRYSHQINTCFGGSCGTVNVDVYIYVTDGTSRVQCFTEGQFDFGELGGTRLTQRALNFTLEKTDTVDDWRIVHNGSIGTASGSTCNLASLDDTKAYRVEFGTSYTKGGTKAGAAQWFLHDFKASGAWLQRNITPGNGTYVENGNFSQCLPPTNSNIARAILSCSEYEGNDINYTYYLSNDAGVTYESVTEDISHIFETSGNDPCYLVGLTGTNESSPAVRTCTMQVVGSSAANVTIDLGNDGSVEYTIDGVLNQSNSPFIANLSPEPGLNTIKLSTEKASILEVKQLVLNSTINPVVFTNSTLEDCSNCEFQFDFGGDDIKVDLIQWDFLGSHNYTVVADMFNGSRDEKKIQIYYSDFNLSHPDHYPWYDVFPNSKDAKNVTPFLQTDSTAIWNVSSAAYDEVFDIYVKTNDTMPSCLNVTYANNASRYLAPISLTLNETWKKSDNSIPVDSWNDGIWNWWDLTNCTNAFELPWVFFGAICTDCYFDIDFIDFLRIIEE